MIQKSTGNGGDAMDDDKIISLYWQRDEEAIAETQKKYGRFCYSIAYGLLKSKEDAEECENDTYLDAWNAIPPQKPKPLSTFLAMITRRRALDRWRGRHAQKRESQMHVVSFEELEECIPVGQRLDERIHAQELAKALSVFLRGLSEVECNVFLRRYWYFDTIRVIAARYDFSESRVKMMLTRTRKKLRNYLQKEGYIV
jgi:RNA polymerase sigma-70 factor (ECF subfamily)